VIVALEGIDGAGKSTAALTLSVELRRRDIDNVLVGGASFADAEDDDLDEDDDDLDDDDDDDKDDRAPEQSDFVIRRMWMYREMLRERFGPRALCLSNAWEFAFRWESLAVPALETGKVVIADRYTDTALVRDVLRGIDESYVRSVYAFLPPPDLVIYLDTAPEIAYRRKTSAGLPIGYFEAGRDVTPRASSLRASFVAFQSKCRQRYEKILSGPHVVRIDGARKADAVHAEILETVLRRIGKPTKGA
jgi:thymidylate kinase